MTNYISTNNTTNLYSILNLQTNCSQADIKHSYKKLVLKWHPDKNPDNYKEAEDKFRNIQMAYEVLNDEKKRAEYDSMSGKEKIELYDTLKQFFMQKYPSFADNFIKKFYDGNEIELQQHIDSFNFGTIYKHILKTVSDDSFEFDLRAPHIEKKEIRENIAESCDIIEQNISINLKTTILDRYKDKYTKIHVKRKTKNDFVGYVRVLEEQVIFVGDGEQTDMGSGDLIINISCPHFYESFRLNEISNDLYNFSEITLYQYLYGGIFKIEHIDGSVQQFESEGFVNKVPVHIFKKKGMPILEQNDDQECYDNCGDNENNLRTDFVVYFKIKNIDNDQFKKIIEPL